MDDPRPTGMPGTTELVIRTGVAGCSPPGGTVGAGTTPAGGLLGTDALGTAGVAGVGVAPGTLDASEISEVAGSVPPLPDQYHRAIAATRSATARIAIARSFMDLTIDLQMPPVPFPRKISGRS